MKKLLMCIWIVLFMTGCGEPDAFETLSDVYVQQTPQQPREVSLDMEPDGVSAVMASEEMGKLYLCDGYTVTLQTMDSGDLDATVLAVTGYARDRLQLIQRQENELVRYECVWTAAGEGGDQVGRTVILDDGHYHYTLTVMADAQRAGSLRETWQALADSFSLAEN